MKVEITEDRLSDTDEESGRHYAQGKGDIITVPDSLGKKWCGYGWAKDVDGKHPTGVRVAGVQPLKVQDSTFTAKGK